MAKVLKGYLVRLSYQTGNLYLQNTSGVHYDIVQDVACSLTPHFNHGCKREQ